jgi:mRNA interferase MazF
MKVSTMTIRPGEFWVAEITFTSGGSSKKRPVLVLWLDGQDAVVAAVTTSQARPPFDLTLVDWKVSGLRKPSVVRLSRLDCLEQSLLIGRIGIVSLADGQRVKEAWSNYIRPQF